MDRPRIAAERGGLATRGLAELGQTRFVPVEQGVSQKDARALLQYAIDHVARGPIRRRRSMGINISLELIDLDFHHGRILPALAAAGTGDPRPLLALLDKAQAIAAERALNIRKDRWDFDFSGSDFDQAQTDLKRAGRLEELNPMQLSSIGGMLIDLWCWAWKRDAVPHHEFRDSALTPLLHASSSMVDHLNMGFASGEIVELSSSQLLTPRSCASSRTSSRSSRCRRRGATWRPS
jgi:hypothetical protein